ncbi:hypothetical protein EDB80DRAFT_684214 [Ilyonectria destructans]|nr:hypothetical protein EDB80DRAFT_684214 [Ilyonectria destructans]
MRASAFILGLFASVEAYKYGYNHPPFLKDDKIAATYFPDIDAKLLSPAFLHPETRPTGFSNGTQGPTSLDILDSYIKAISNKNSWMTYKRFNFASEEGRRLSYLLLSNNPESETYGPNGGGNKKLRVWIQAAVHGDEPGADQAVLALLGKLDANQKWTRSLLRHLDILILPRYSPDGVFYFQDVLASNYDPNRDHIKLARRQTRNIKTKFSEFAPHIAVDVHEFAATRQYGRYHFGVDSLFAAAKNLNINPDIRHMAESLFVTKVSDALEARGLRSETYVTGKASNDTNSNTTFSEAGSDAKIGRNAMGLTQCIAFLSETRGIGIGDQHFQRRVASGLTFLSSILQTAADHTAEVLNVIESSVEDFISNVDEIVVTDYTKFTQRTFPLIDVTNSTLVQAPIGFRSATPTTANLTRSRPEAYLIPSSWADLAERLRCFGLKVQTLGTPWKGTVEALTVTSAVFAPGYYEGYVPIALTTETATRHVELPAGSFLVSTRQRNAGLAFVALEPENVDSWASSNIIPVQPGDEHPVFRVMAYASVPG